MQVGFRLPGSPSQAGSKPGDVCRWQAPISLWPLGASGVQIPLPAPFFRQFLRLFCINGCNHGLFVNISEISAKIFTIKVDYFFRVFITEA